MNKEDFYANKLTLSTIIGLVALFSSIFGLFPAMIAMKMADEMPMDYSPVDVKRARQISTAAFVINLIEVIGGIVTGVVLLLAYKL